MTGLYPLRIGTAQTLRIGPVVQVADGATPIDDLDFAADSGARFALDGESIVDVTGRTWVHEYGGHYRVSLLTTDVPALGRGKLILTNPSLFCPLWKDVVVLPANLYDALYVDGMSAFAVSLILGPTYAVSSPPNSISSPVRLGVFKAQAKTFTLAIIDSEGDPVDLTGKDLRFVVETATSAPVEAFDVDSGSISVSGSPVPNIASVPTTQAQNLLNTETEYQWRLWDDLAHAPLAHGPYSILPTSETP